MTTPRREFLQYLGAGGVLAAAGVPPRVRADTVPGPRPISTKWDMSWCDRLNGTVRGVFDSPAVDEGGALFRAQLWRTEHKEVYGTAPADANAVIVFRHEGIPLIMNDAFWKRFDMGKELKIKDAKGKKWTTANPVASTPAGTPPQYADYNLPAFIASGGIVLACNLAFGDMIEKILTADKLSRADARKAALAQVIPGVILQPSGAFALLRAQQAGCSYMMAS